MSENEPTSKSVSLSRRLVFIVKLLVSLGLLTILLHRVGWSALVDYIGSVRWGHLALVFLALTAQYWIITASLSSCLKFNGICVDFPRLFRICVISLFFNQFLPAALGGMVARTVLLRRYRFSLRGVVFSLILDRMTNAFGLVLLVLLLGGVFLVHPLPVHGNRVFYPVSLIMVGLILFLFLIFISSRLPEAWQSFPPYRPLFDLLREIHAFLMDRETLFKTVLFGVLWHLIVLFSLWLLAIAIPEAEVPLLSFFGIAAVASLIALVPVSVAGWGLREGALILLLPLVDIPEKTAFSISVTYGSILLFSRIPGLFLWLRMKRTMDEDRSEEGHQTQGGDQGEQEKQTIG